MNNLPQNVINQINEADSLMRNSRSSEAVTILKQAIKICENEPYLYYLLGIARTKCARFFLAKRALEKADRLEPNNSENLRGLGWVNIMLGELEQGRKELREAINLDLTNALAYLDLGMSYIQYFQPDEAMEWFDRAKALSPQNPFVARNYEIAQKMKKDILKFSKDELKKAKQERLEPRHIKSSRLFMIQEFLDRRKNKELFNDEIEEINEELKMNGVMPQIMTVDDEKNPDNKAVVEYIQWHNKVKDVERKISEKEEKEIENKLFTENTSLKELKTCILRLAHQDTESALSLLQKFEKQASKELKIWTKTAIDECKFFIEQ